MTSPFAEHRRMQVLLGTYVDIRARADDESCARHAVECAIKAIATVQHSMSFHDPHSELTRLHRRAWRSPVQTSAPLFRVLRASIALSRASEGAFDITTAGALVRADRLPLPSGCPEPDRTACFKHIELLSERRVRFRAPLLVDLGGIAKGYALDLAIAAMRRAGASAASVNAGGDMRVYSAKSFAAYVRHPTMPNVAYEIARVRDGAVATTAPYLSDASARAGLVDPSYEELVEDVASVTVLAPRGIWADALTKIVALRPNRCGSLLRRLGAEALRISRDGTARVIRADSQSDARWTWQEAKSFA